MQTEDIQIEDMQTENKRTASLRVQNMHIASHIILIIWTFVALFPIWVMVINSFKTAKTIYINPFWVPAAYNFKHYMTVLNDSNFLMYFKNTATVVVVSIALVLIFGALAAYALANWKRKMSTAMFFFIIAGMMLPIRIASVKLIEVMRVINFLDNSLWALPAIYIAIGIPIAVSILTSFVRAVPHELIEAGFIDGAGHFRIFSQIIVPMLRPPLATVGIYNLVPYWNDIWFPLILTNKESDKTLLLGVTRLFGQYFTDWSKVLAVLTLSALPVILLYLLMSKQFIKGMTAGAVKG
jgi:raffinose/stachyose/melibiose transport system permease protein